MNGTKISSFMFLQSVKKRVGFQGGNWPTVVKNVVYLMQCSSTSKGQAWLHALYKFYLNYLYSMIAIMPKWNTPQTLYDN